MTPNPGSDEAVAQGCACPVLDNNHGVFAPFGDGEDEEWFLSSECPIHGGADAAMEP